MSKTSVALLALFLGSNMAMAEQVAIPLLAPSDIQGAIDPQVFQGVSGASAGAVYFPDQALAVRINQGEGDAAQIVSQWTKTHAFYLVPFSISISAADNHIPEQVDVAAAFGGQGDLTKQPLIIDTFPKTGFKPASYSGSGEVKVDGALQLEPLPGVTAVPGASAKLGADVNAAFKFTYAPAYANIVSGFASGHAFWQFKRTQQQYPIGEIPMKLLIAVPKTIKSDAIKLRFDVKAQFSGSWWTKGLAIASFETLVGLPGRT